MKEKKISLDEAFKTAVNFYTKGNINEAKNILEKILEVKSDHFLALANFFSGFFISFHSHSGNELCASTMLQITKTIKMYKENFFILINKECYHLILHLRSYTRFLLLTTRHSRGTILTI